ncbi:putative holo-(acyl-carrier-protein) synthase [Calothrix parasitica NIES-267]|uniref:Holo-[acyl-carrier-protein] synthase n=1 Tax=Calothrix parasitica NIES-267 TaxID=1973488 RepID=A0A1Z4LT34_9CYAN|nr:putative holo-(acyl-carrier-protein) synthase [Calothrix parasitica NIES-267]
MKIIGHGIVIVEVPQIQKLIEQEPKYFVSKYFTAIEHRNSKYSINYIHYLAGRFAAKQAVMKAMKMELSWLEIEIQRLSTGKPLLVLYDESKKIAAEQGIVEWLVSISHTSSYATASAIALTPITL